MVLFVGTREGQDTAVVRAAQLAKGYHLFERWIPGSITNGQQILSKCAVKVVNHRDEPVEGFEEQLFERPVLRPDLVVCVNPLENYVLLHECALNNIPTIGVIDTNVNPTWVTYPIPANDDRYVSPFLLPAYVYIKLTLAVSAASKSSPAFLAGPVRRARNSVSKPPQEAR
jgi:small subunit ribosomal protein S2